MSLQDALETLNAAHGPKALAAAYLALRSQVTASRLAFKKSFGPLAQTYIEAMRIWDAQKAQGVSFAERAAGLEKTLRVAWPQTRAWTYICQDCSDYGLIICTCSGEETCGRSEPHLAHEFGRPCWCKQGQRFKDPPKPEPGDFTRAAKGSRTMTRIGR